MSIEFGFTSSGAFVCGDTETRRTSFAYPTSEHATKAARSPGKVAAEMIAAANSDTAHATDPYGYDARNWRTLCRLRAVADA